MTIIYGPNDKPLKRSIGFLRTFVPDKKEAVDLISTVRVEPTDDSEEYTG